MNRLILSSLLLLSGISANAQHLLEALDAPNTNAKCIERVKDRNYGDGDHNFIYCAVQGPNGKKWLNLNLGAEYAKEGSPYFNPEAQPTDYNDWKAFGSLFQDGRKADGHELVEYYNSQNKPSVDDDRIKSTFQDTWYNSWYVKRVNPITNTTQDVLNSSNAYVYYNHRDYWASNRDNQHNLWAGQMLNNPCPQGYRVMNESDIKSLLVNDTSKIKIDVNQGDRTTSLFQNTDYPNLIIVTAPIIDTQEPIVVISRAKVYHKTLTILKDYDLEDGTSSLWMMPPSNSDIDIKYVYNNISTPLGWTVEENIEKYPFPKIHYHWVFDRGIKANRETSGFSYNYGYVYSRVNSMAIRCVEQ